MKKLLISLLVLLLVLVGCQNNAGNKDEKKPEEKVEEKKPTEEKKPEEKPAANDAKINIYTRDASSGTREAFEKGIKLEKGQLSKDASEVDGNGSMATKVGADENGIGYVSLTTDFEANNLKKVNYKGVEATEENVLGKKYELQRPFAYTTRAKGDFGDETTEKVVAAFIDFLHNSQEGLDAVKSKGGIVKNDAAKPWKELKANHPVLNGDVSKVTIKTAGSTSVDKTLKAALQAFEADTGVKFVMNQTGSGDGFKRTLGADKDSANSAHIGFASREFDPKKEDVTKAMASDSYCLDAVVVVVNKKNEAVNDLTPEQLVKIFSGEITKFADIK